MRNYVASSVALLTLSALTACGTAPRRDALTICPALPAIAKEELGPDFQDQTRLFLSGKLPEPTASAQPSLPATNSTTTPAPSSPALGLRWARELLHKQ